MTIIKFYDPRHNGEGLVCLLDCPLHLCQFTLLWLLQKKCSRKECLPRLLDLFCSSTLNFFTRGTNRDY